MYKFNEIHKSKNEIKYIEEAIKSGKLQANGDFDKKISLHIEKTLHAKNTFLVNSCTAALEVAALLLEIKSGDEIIMPSYTYVTTASAFLRAGAKIIFVDVDEKTMCIDLEAAEVAITARTRAIVAVHYAAVSCDMDRLMDIAKKHEVVIIEDAAQSIYSKYKDRYLGGIGHIGCFSFHETKNISSGGEGGMLLINEKKFLDNAKMIIEKGTDRSEFLENKVSKYTWKTLGSSFGLSQLNAAFLYAQLEEADYIIRKRLNLLKVYILELSKLKETNNIGVFEVPNYNTSNGHMFYIKTRDEEERKELVLFLKANNIESVSHYEPLHTSQAGKKICSF